MFTKQCAIFTLWNLRSCIVWSWKRYSRVSLLWLCKKKKWPGVICEHNTKSFSFKEWKNKRKHETKSALCKHWECMNYVWYGKQVMQIVNEFEYKWEHMATECIWKNNGLQVEWKYDEMTDFNVKCMKWKEWQRNCFVYWQMSAYETYESIWIWHWEKWKEWQKKLFWAHMKHMKAYEYDIVRISAYKDI